jgi:ABC-type multidrug transport system fused ATPase/permease subunit
MRRSELILFFVKSLKLVSRDDRRRYTFVATLQASMALLDLVGVAFIAILAGLSIKGVQSKSPDGRTNEALKLLGIENLEFQSQVAVLGFIATIFFIMKTILTIFSTRKILFFLARKSAEISKHLTERFLCSNLNFINTKPVAEAQYILGVGVQSITLGILGLGATVIADLTLLVVITVGVILIDPVIAIFSFIMFSSIGLILYLLLHKGARRIGSEIQEYSVKSNSQLEESIMAYREIFVRGSLKFYADKIDQNRKRVTHASADQVFLPNISKYIIETSVILGAVAISAIQFALNDAVNAAAGLALFIAAGSRLAPALLRVQQNLVTMQSNIGSSLGTFQLIENMSSENEFIQEERALDLQHIGFHGEVSLRNVSFSYSDSGPTVLKNINLEIKPGTFIALVGPSGAGKSTLADLILGIREPDLGEVSISGLSPKSAILEFPGAIGYVPQEVAIFNSSVLKNIALGYEISSETELAAQEALKFAHFSEEFLVERVNGHSDVTSRGTNLSGGQRQRIGLARAIFTKPRLLILDEATSSLDSKTENSISQSLLSLHGEVTLIVIAHRLSTVRSADIVVYMGGNGVLTTGTFEEVRSQVPEFEEQANLMGL